MSWQEDGSAELDEAVRDIRTKWTPEQIAERLDKWGRDGVTSGYGAHAATSGDYAHAATSGCRAHAATSGYGANAEVKGKDAIAAVLGRECKARGALGCWLVLTERDDDWHILGVQAVKVDGKKYKADTWYKLRGGEIVEAKKEG